VNAAFSLRARRGYLLNGDKTPVFVIAGLAMADIMRTCESIADTPL